MIRLISTLFVFILISITLNAQTPPNFNVTDSWGNTHRLYEDYLDQGKTVVIKVFYTTCPPCNAIASSLEPLYQEWGGGQADVQFIELSILSSDTDVKVNNYKSSHNTTFPAVGSAGGSVAAVEVYKNGTFGQYTGTPTFVVIAPDKTVQYDVFGSGISGTIAALDEAIENTGATGIISSTTDPAAAFPVSLRSNLVTNQLVFEFHSEVDNVTISIVDPLGQTSGRHELNSPQVGILNYGIDHLPSGLWIGHIEIPSTGKQQAFRFFKL